MIDTVNIRILNATRYGLIEYLDRAEHGRTNFMARAEDLERLKDRSVSATVYNDTDRFTVLRKPDKLYNPTSNYFIGYLPDHIKDHVDFEFSLPKWLYGHNIAQLVNTFDPGDPGICFEVFTRAIWDFIKMSLNARINDRDVQVRRIDMCYNQFFESMDDALTYCEAMQPGFARLARKNGVLPVPYDGGYTYTTRRMSFKFYHKGTEFQKHDYYKLLENGTVGKHSAVDLLEIANKVVRYECTFRGSYLNYLFNQMYEKSERATSGVKGSVYRWLFYDFDMMKGKSISRRFCMESEYDKDDRDFFYFNKPFDYWEDLRDPESVTFDRLLFKRLYDYTWSMIKKIAVTPGGDSRDVLRRIQEHNNKLKGDEYWSGKKIPRVSEKRVLLWFHISQKPGGLKRSMKKGFMSARNYYYVLKLFRAIGLSNYNPVVRTVNPGYGYGDYKSLFSYLH